MRKLLTILAAMAVFAVAAPADAQDNRLSAGIFAGGEISAHEDFEVHAPGLGIYAGAQFGRWSFGLSRLDRIANRKHSWTSVDAAYDLGPVRGIAWYGQGDVDSGPDPNGEPTDPDTEWNRFGVGAAFSVHGLRIEIRVADDVAETKTVELRLGIN